MTIVKLMVRDTETISVSGVIWGRKY